jgi:hypothetical protein
MKAQYIVLLIFILSLNSCMYKESNDASKIIVQYYEGVKNNEFGKTWLLLTERFQREVNINDWAKMQKSDMDRYGNYISNAFLHTYVRKYNYNKKAQVKVVLLYKVSRKKYDTLEGFTLIKNDDENNYKIDKMLVKEYDPDELDNYFK